MKFDSKKAARLKDCHQAMSAAFAAFEAEEPGAEHKYGEAKGNYDAAMKEFEGEESEPTIEGGGDTGGATPSAEGAAMGGATQMPNPQEAGAYDADRPTVDFDADPSGAYTELVNQFDSFRKDMIPRVTRAEVQNKALIGKLLRKDFEAEMGKLKAADHDFDATSFGKAFDAAAGNPTMVEHVYALLRKSPKKQTPENVGQVFDASSANKRQPGQTTTQEALADLQKITGQTFSESDLRLGDICAMPKGR